MMSAHFPFDVLVCSYNEAPHIPRLLESLRRQTVGAAAFHVIFVDNASTDTTRTIVQENANSLDLEYVHEPRQGKNWACNAGYRHATTPYVAHIDADCKANVNWIENIDRVIKQESPDLCGGPYYPYYISPKPRWYVDRYNSHEYGGGSRYLNQDEYLTGANMVWRRDVVLGLGGFATEVGLRGRGLARGDETNLLVRARHEIPDLKVYYDPRIVVYHLTRKQTMSPWYVCKRAFAEGRHTPAIWGVPLMGRKVAIRVALREARTIVFAMTWNALVRDRCAHPYRENYIVEVVARHFSTLGYAMQSIRA